jgi:alpha-D-ribose 1-methylphosphonate 5-triphosphate synthase subunit PhnH
MKIDHPGFADPVRDAQSCFRAVLEAMSRPGRIMQVGAELSLPAPLTEAAGAALLTLLDADTSLCLAEEAPELRDWLAFHCGVGFAPMRGARFVWARALPDLDALDTGTDEEPEDSATVVLQVAALGQGSRFMLAGPGLAAPAPFAVSGLPADFAARWAANHALFPRGVDLILCAGTALAALPRSVTVAEG